MRTIRLFILFFIFCTFTCAIAQNYRGTPTRNHFDSGKYYDAAGFTSLANAVTIAEADSSVLYVSTSITISANVTIPRCVDLIFRGKGYISVDSGDSLYINGNVDAGQVCIFGGDGIVEMEGSTTTTLYASWFGWSEDSSGTANATFVSRAINDAPDDARVIIDPGSYDMINTAELKTTSITVINYADITIDSAASSAWMFYFDTDEVTGSSVVFENHGILDGNSTEEADNISLLFFQDCDNVFVKNYGTLQNTNYRAIEYEDIEQLHIDPVGYINDTGYDGITGDGSENIRVTIKNGYLYNCNSILGPAMGLVGNYLYVENIVIDCAVEGDGLSLGHSVDMVAHYAEVTGVTVLNIKTDGYGIGIKGGMSDYAQIRDCKIFSPDSTAECGISLEDDDVYDTAGRVIITGCTITGKYDDGCIYIRQKQDSIHAARQSIISNNYFNSSITGSAGIFLQSGHDILISNNYFNMSDNGINLRADDDAEYDDVARIHIIGNHADCDAAFVNIQATATDSIKMEDINIFGNYYIGETGDYLVNFQTAAEYEGINIFGNYSNKYINTSANYDSTEVFIGGNRFTDDSYYEYNNIGVSVDDSLRIGYGSWLGAIQFGSDVFTTTAIADTVLISGAVAADKYLLTSYGTGSVDQQDVLMGEAKVDTLIVHRLADGASGLTYHWWLFK